MDFFETLQLRIELKNLFDLVEILYISQQLNLYIGYIQSIVPGSRVKWIIK